MTEPTVERRPNVYEIRVADEVAGIAQFLDRDNQRIIYHTEVDPKFRGLGLSKTLIRAALDDTRQAGLRIVPACPAVSRYVKKHDSYDDVTDKVTPDLLTWLKTALAAG